MIRRVDTSSRDSCSTSRPRREQVAAVVATFGLAFGVGLLFVLYFQVTAVRQFHLEGCSISRLTVIHAFTLDGYTRFGTAVS